MRGRVIAAVLAGAVAAAVAACERIDRNMWDNPAFAPQEEPVRLAPKDSIPTKGVEHLPALADASRLANPVKPSEGELLRGKELFGIFCVPCHGEGGAGDGPVGKKYVPAPADLRAGSPVMGLSDGQLFVIVSSGLGGMPAFRADLPPNDRWRVIAYVRTLKGGSGPAP
ncbi:MAG: c-type cytochrome [Gemmatimonadota bacterium]